MEIFSIFAQSSIAIIAFTSIVAQFKRQSDSDWNPFLFVGMVNHAFVAFVASVLPFIVEPFLTDPKFNWVICGWIVGLYTFFHGISVMFVDKSSGFKLKISLMISCTIIFILQILNIFEVFWETNHGVYAISVFWHIYQSLFIFALFIFSNSKKTEKEEVKKGEYEKML